MATATHHLLQSLSDKHFTHITDMETTQNNHLQCWTCKENMSNWENRLDLIEHLLVRVLSITAEIRDQMRDGRY